MGLNNLDIFPKYRDDLKVRSLCGGLFSVSAVILMGVLFVSEVLDFLTPTLVDHLVIDEKGDEHIRVNLNVSFPRVSCDLIAFDIKDSHPWGQGATHSGNEDEISVRRIRKDGSIVMEDFAVWKSAGGVMSEDKVVAEKKEGEAEKKEEECASCYGAETEERKCCPRCQDVLDAYRAKGWAAMNPKAFSQCKTQDVELKQKLDQHDQGCNFAGHIEIRKGTGDFHFAPTHVFTDSHEYHDDFTAFVAGHFDTSHIINHLSFGKEHKESEVLDGHDGWIEGDRVLFQYYTKVVPTVSVDESGKELNSYQFSVTTHQTNVKRKTGRGLPGVFFFYEISPLQVRSQYESKPLFPFLTNLCAIMGGIFTLIGLLDRAVFKTMKSLEAKIEIGKAS